MIIRVPCLIRHFSSLITKPKHITQVPPSLCPWNELQPNRLIKFISTRRRAIAVIKSRRSFVVELHFSAISFVPSLHHLATQVNSGGTGVPVALLTGEGPGGVGQLTSTRPMGA